MWLWHVKMPCRSYAALMGIVNSNCVPNAVQRCDTISSQANKIYRASCNPTDPRKPRKAWAFFRSMKDCAWIFYILPLSVGCSPKQFPDQPTNPIFRAMLQEKLQTRVFEYGNPTCLIENYRQSFFVSVYFGTFIRDIYSLIQVSRRVCLTSQCTFGRVQPTQ